MMTFCSPFIAQKIYASKAKESRSSFYNQSKFDPKKGFTFHIIDKVPALVNCTTNESGNFSYIYLHYISTFYNFFLAYF